VLRLDATEHDSIFAAVSHLPHVVAYALVNALARRSNAKKLFGFSAGGLRDTVRIAGSSPEMWTDICIANRETAAGGAAGLRGRACRMRAAIARGDAAQLKRMFAAARGAREKWLVKRRSGT
jgi:prephenate dehydrogenase